MTSCGCSNCGQPAGEDLPDPRLAAALADWLTDLDLVDQLAEARLPGFTRDPDGTPHWHDPNTGDPLTATQLAELNALLHSDGSDPTYAVPVDLLQLRRRAQVRAGLLASDWFDYEALARVRGESVNAIRFLVHKAASENRLLVVPRDEQRLVPAFQFDAAAEPRPELEPVLLPLLASGMDPWHVWGWLTQPAALLGGQVPEQAAADPEEAPIVRHAAVRLAERSGA
ncbi:hypothetical protein [Nocardioides sp. AE5]|uniref:hypothetical protein n=1 Tax=Nocardioides sp. AE5 TaxID=2962573 RepID=UPI002882C065|nr:hypothetical protein [Nocardioides sp. AE5]MDT0202958.1 hypothetical protein [Nocardioides sp. AE5]